MSGPTVVVLPVSPESGQHSQQDTAQIASTLQNALYEKSHPEQDNPGPLKQMLAQPESLYKYISWEDPTRTLGVYLGALSILFAAHYLPLTQVALKAGLITLGVVSVTEFATRSFSTNSLSTRLRPKEYKKIPEPVLNATLKDIHDFIQYATVQSQRIIFGQDLDKTFAAFLGFTALYWLTKMLSPFWLAVMVLNSIFVAPLVSSLQGRRIAHDAGVRAQEVANVAADKGRALAQNGKAKAAELSSKGKQTAADLSAQARGTASDMSGTAADLSSKGKQTAADLSAQARGTASNMSGTAAELSSKGKQTTADLSAQARGTASDMSGTAAENIRKVPQMGANAINETSGKVSSAFGDAKGYMSTPPSNNVDGNSDGNRSATGGVFNKLFRSSNNTSETTRQIEPRANTGKQPYLDHRQNAVYSSPAQPGVEKIGSVADTGYQYASAEDAAATHRIPDRPRDFS